MRNAMILFSSLLLGLQLLSSCEDKATDLPSVMSIHAIGKATAVPTQLRLPGIELEVSGNAFTMDFFDAPTAKRLGTVTDINVATETFEDGRMKGENYTLFTFEADNSTLLLHNFIDMTPISATALQAIIPADQTKYNVIAGTGRFAHASGGSTLLAFLDMTEFDIGKVGFDCHYRISFK